MIFIFTSETVWKHILKIFLHSILIITYVAEPLLSPINLNQRNVMKWKHIQYKTRTIFMLFYKFFFYFIKFWSINCFISTVYPLILLNLFLLKLHIYVCVCVYIYICMYISSVTFEFMLRVILILLWIRRKNMSLMITLLKKTRVYLLSHFLFSLQEIIFGEKSTSILTFNCI